MQNLHVWGYLAFFISKIFPIFATKLRFYFTLKKSDNDKKLFAMMAAVALLVGVSGCAVDDNPAKIVLSPEEQALVGLWWDGTWLIGSAHAQLDLPIEGGYYAAEGHVGPKRGFYWTSSPASSSGESMALTFNAAEGYQVCRTRAYANQIDFSVRLFCRLPKK